MIRTAWKVLVAEHRYIAGEDRLSETEVYRMHREVGYSRFWSAIAAISFSELCENNPVIRPREEQPIVQAFESWIEGESSQKGENA